MQTGLEKNLFGNHPVSLPAVESRGPPPAFASDPLMQVSATSSSPSIAKDETNYADGYSASGAGPSKSSISDIVEIDDPSSAGNPLISNHETNFMKSTSPSGVR